LPRWSGRCSGENSTTFWSRRGQSELDLDAIHIALTTDTTTGDVDIRADKPVHVALKLKEK